MIEAIAIFGESPWLMVPSPYSETLLFLGPLIIFAFMYMLSKLEQGQMVSGNRLVVMDENLNVEYLYETNEISEKPGLEISREFQAYFAMDSKEYESESESEVYLTDSLKIEGDKRLDILSIIKDIKIRPNNQDNYDFLNFLKMPNYFELGILATITLGGAGLFFLEDYRGQEKDISALTDSISQYPSFQNKLQKINIDNSSYFGLEKLEKASLLPGPSTREKKLDILPGSQISMFNSPELDLIETSNIDLLRRRLMFELTPQEYALLIPTSLELEWYGLGKI